jgi:hypothetical protein
VENTRRASTGKTTKRMSDDNRKPNDDQRDALLPRGWLIVCASVLCLALLAVAYGLLMSGRTEELTQARFDELLTANRITEATINLNPKSIQHDVVGSYSADGSTNRRFHARVVLPDNKLTVILNNHPNISKNAPAPMLAPWR